MDSRCGQYTRVSCVAYVRTEPTDRARSAMSKITSYFAPCLPLSRETNIGEAATKEASKQVKRVLEQN